MGSVRENEVNCNVLTEKLETSQHQKTPHEATPAGLHVPAKLQVPFTHSADTLPTRFASHAPSQLDWLAQLASQVEFGGLPVTFSAFGSGQPDSTAGAMAWRREGGTQNTLQLKCRGMAKASV